MNKLAILYTTISSLKEAEHLARQAVEARLAICVNIIPGTQSIYVWDNKIESAVESCMIFKTMSDHLPMLERWIINHHPYDTPAILKWEAQSSEAFYQYIVSHLQGQIS